MSITRLLSLAGSLTALWLLFSMWPNALGGDATYIKVAGNSMEPALHGGDLVVTKQKASYAIGDVIAYRVSNGVVIHRIVGGDSESGFVTQGDNRPRTDAWLPTAEEIVGAQTAHLPYAGRFVNVLSRPPALAAGAFLLILAAGVSGAPSRKRRLA